MVFGNYDENIKENNSKNAAIEKEISILRGQIKNLESRFQEKKDKRERLEKEFDTYVKKEEKKVEEKLKDLGMKIQRAEKNLDMAKDNVNECERGVNNYPTQTGRVSGMGDFYRKKFYNAKVELKKQMDAVKDAQNEFNKEKIHAKSKAKFTNERTKKLSETIDSLDRKLPKYIKEIQKGEDIIKKKEDRIHKIQEQIRDNELMKHYAKEAEMKKKMQEPLVEKLPNKKTLKPASKKKNLPNKKTLKPASTKKECPKGSKLNKKTRRCNKNKPNKTKRARCPNGSRKNLKSGSCEIKK